MARIAGVVGCTVSLLSTVPPAFDSPVTARSAAPQSAYVASSVRIQAGKEIVPAVSLVSDFTFDTDSREFISDESLLSSLPEEDCGESASFGLEGYVTSGVETLGRLAQRYSLNAEALALLNGKAINVPLPPGSRVSLFRGDVEIYTAEKGDTFEQIARKFGTDALLLSVCNHASSEVMAGGERIFVPQGILECEGEADVEDRPSNVITPAPAKPATQLQARELATSRKRNRFGKVVNFREKLEQLAWPIQGRVTSTFGWRHHPILNSNRFHCGIDISAPAGSAIRSVADGRVIFAGWRGASGRTVVVRHANNLASIYAHCSQLLVDVGDTVSSRQLIARAGSSGRATGSHLHFAMERGKSPVNPLKYLR